MLFSSLEFIFRFLPVFLVLYYITPKEYRNIVLFLGSLFFYACGEPVYVVLLLASSLLNYLLGRWIDGSKGAQRRFPLVIGVIYNVAVLALFKYADALVLPIGISFYTFQAIGYLTDVYRCTIRAEQQYGYFATYLCMFPQLTAGPLVGYAKVGKELHSRSFSLQTVERGVQIFVCGLALKVLLANRLDLIWNNIQTIGFRSISTPMAWLGAAIFSMEIYFDFLGYSLMAIGVGRMLGFHLPANFRMPYMAGSVHEFYRRWHMTLGAWFKNYVYIPLGGNRRSRIVTCRNLLIVWVLTGIWHGAELNYLLWGLTLGLLIVLEKLFLSRLLNKSAVIGRIYVLLVIPMTWVLFAIENVKEIGIYYGRMFGLTNGGVVINHADFFQTVKDSWVLLLVGILCITPLPRKIMITFRNRYVRALALFALFWLCIYYLRLEGTNPFLYYRF